MANFPTQAILLAAGLGTRLRPFTQLTPKALLPVLGVPVLEYWKKTLQAQGIQSAVVNTFHLAHQIEHALATPSPIQWILSPEQKLLGSGGGVFQAKGFLKNQQEAFFLINLDLITSANLNNLWQAHQKLRSYGVKATLLLKQQKLPNYSSIDCKPLGSPELGLIHQIQAPQPNSYFYASIAVIDPDAFDEITIQSPCELLATFLKPAIEKKQLGYFIDPHFWWLDIGSPGLWAQAHFLLMQWIDQQDPRSLIEQEIKALIYQANQNALWTRKAFSSPKVLAPFYWNPQQTCSRVLGPFGICYGDLPSEPLSQFISYQSQRVSLTKEQDPSC